MTEADTFQAKFSPETQVNSQGLTTPLTPRFQKSTMAIFTSITILSLGLAGVFAYQNYRFKKQAQQVEPTFLPGIISPSPTTGPQQNNETEGTVTGRVCFPSEGIPAGNILAKDVSSGETFKQEYLGSEVAGKTDYSFKLKPGIYVFAYDPGRHGQNMGYYTSCAESGHANECSTKESHSLTEITVVSGESINDIDLCDYYYKPEHKPDF